MWRDQGEMARETGLEPATSGVTGRRSNQLSYSPFFGRARNRTLAHAESSAAQDCEVSSRQRRNSRALSTWTSSGERDSASRTSAALTPMPAA